MSHRARRKVVEIFVAAVVALTEPAWADTRDTIKTDAGETNARPLQLEVSINGMPINLIGSFVQLANGKIASRRSELTSLGFAVPGAGDNDLVVIDDLAGLKYRYDEPRQTIAFDLPDRLRAVRTYDARGSPDASVEPRSDFGGVLNYDLFADAALDSRVPLPSPVGASAAFEGRVFGDFGVLAQSAVLNLTTEDRFEAIRLNTTWTYADPDELLTYRAGDTITGGTRWTRPVRLGGVQIQRSFGLRPDLITFPLPSISGSAVVPSTIDLYVDGALTHSQEIGSGPYEFQNIPVSPGHGDVVVVVRDAAGRRNETELSFYSTPQLLREGLTYFSAEAGFARLSFGSDKNRYDDSIVSSATIVHGLHDWLTVEAHTEVGAGLVNAGAGTMTRLGNWGVASVAASASGFEGDIGFQTSLAYDLQLAAINIHASSLRTWESYSDLGVATAKGGTHRPARALDSVSFGMPLYSDDAQVGATFLHQETALGEHRRTVMLSLSHPLFDNATAYVSAFADVSGADDYGVFAGLSVPIGQGDENDFMLSSGVQASRSGTTYSVEAAHSPGLEPGSFGWRLNAAEGKTTFRRASATYRADTADFGAAIQQSSGDTHLTAQASGAIVVLGTDPFVSRRIDDAFVVVDAGAPGVRVKRENRPAGVTDGRGLLLVTDVQSYNRNNIGIDARDLPLNADGGVVHKVVAPNDRSGVRVDFAGDSDTNVAVVIITDSGGGFIRPGTQGRIVETGEPIVMGYDGRIFVRHLRATNTITLDTQIACSATFSFTPDRARQVVIGPLTCQ